MCVAMIESFRKSSKGRLSSPCNPRLNEHTGNYMTEVY